MGQHVRVLPHIGRAHRLGQAGRGGLNAAELLGSLRPVAEWERSVQIEIRRLDAHVAQLVDRELPQHLTGLSLLPPIEFDLPGGRLMQLAKNLTGFEVDDRLLFDRLIGLTPADDGDFQHGGLSVAGRKKDVFEL